MTDETTGTKGKALGKPLPAMELGTFDPYEGTPDAGSAERITAFVRDGQAMKAMATAIAKSGAYRSYTTPEKVMTAMLAAYELNIGIATALKGMYPVSGKLELETWLMAGLAVMRTGVTWEDVEVSEKRVVLKLHRQGWEPKEVEYTLQHAEKMGLIRELDYEAGTFKTGKDAWRRSTEEMLYWRCLSKGLRRIAPDYFGGYYVRGEIVQELTPEGGPSMAAEDLHALVHGVEPDAAEMSEDEIDKCSSELRSARKAGVITEEREKEISELLVKGQWAEAREAWEVVRIEMARAEADAEQGALL